MAVFTAVPMTFVAQSVVNAAANIGSWDSVMDWGLQGKHMAQLPTGNVLVWSTGANARVWNPADRSFTDAPALFGDLHCAGNAQIADGRVIVLGGQDKATHVGTTVTALFDAANGTWSAGRPMNYARWYASVTPLADGKVLATSGDDASGNRVMTPEVYDPTANTWTKLTGAVRSQDLYPQMYVLPNGKVFEAAPGSSTALLDVNANGGTGSWSAGPTNGWATNGYSESSVMYEPGKIMRAGGGDPAIARTAVVDMTAASPQWTETAPMNHARRRMNMVILADGSVLAVGGTAAADDESRAVLTAELWNPTTKVWTDLASMTEARMYHSSAVLLTDGRVLTSGGEAAGRLRAQIFSPPYLSQGARPTITSAPATAGYTSTIDLTTPNTDVTSVALIRLNASTHAWDQNQRYVPLSFAAGPSGHLLATAPANGSIAPPGSYQLVIKNAAGVPSVAKIIRLDNTANLTPGTVTGTVTDAGSHLPITGAAVAVPGGSATTASDGRYTITGVTPGEHVVTITASGYAKATKSVIVGAGQSVTADFALVPPGTITGTVTRASNAGPVEGALVSHPGGSTFTDAQGHYTLADTPSGSVVVTVTAIGFDTMNHTVAVPANSTVTDDFALNDAATFITGGVSDQVTGNPIVGATVSYSGGTTTTNALGSYRFDVAPGTYDVTASAPGYQSATHTSIVSTGTYAVTDFPLALIPSGPSRIKEISFENGALVHALTGASKKVGTVALESASPLDDAYSATMATGNSYLEQTLPSPDDLYAAFLFRLGATPGSDARVVQILNGSTTVGVLQVRATGKLRLRVGSTNVGSESAALVPGQIYRIGLHQKRGTSADGVLEAFVAPVNTVFGAAFAKTTTGAWTTPPTALRFGPTTSTAANITFDGLILDSAAMPGGGVVSPLPAPTAGFTLTPTSGAAPLPVTFTDTSTGSPATWAWNFGDGTTASAQSPSHTYTTPGTYTVTLSVSNTTGTGTAARTNAVTVTAAGAVLTVLPTADAQVKSTSATTNYGTATTVRLRKGTTASPGDYNSYLQFAVTGVTGTITSAKLRLYVTDASTVAGSIFAVPGGWAEKTITWTTAPAITGTPVVTVGAAALGAWAEFDVTSAVTGNGTVGFGLTTTTTDSVIYSSREGAHPPELVITQS